MHEPYTLTIRFHPHDTHVLLHLETDDGAGDIATMTPPFGADLPLVLRALDAAQIPPPMDVAAWFTQPERDRLTALGLWHAPRPVPDIHARVGRALLAALTADAAAARLLDQARAAAAAADRGLDLVVRFPHNAPLLADLPWELLWESPATGTGLPLLLAQGNRSSCTRYLSLPRALPPPHPPGQALTLLAVSPLAQIRAEVRTQHRRMLTQALQPHVDAGRVTLIMPEPPLSVERLLDLVDQHRPDILSFYGHGDYRDDQGCLLLDTPEGGMAWVPADRLAPLADAGVRLLLLHACRSDQAGPAGFLTGTATLLSALRLPAIMAMQSYIRMSAAARLQAVVCGGLAAGQSVQAALAWARAVLYAEAQDASGWYVPTLTLAQRDARPMYLLHPPR